MTTTPTEPEPKRKPERIGCPNCGSLNLAVEQIIYETGEFYTDGTYQFLDMIEYGKVLSIYCSDCEWKVENENNKGIDFIQAHNDFVRAEMIKEMKEMMRP